MSLPKFRNAPSPQTFVCLALLVLFASSSLYADKAGEFDPAVPLEEGHGYLFFGMHSPNPAVSVRFKSGFTSYKTEDFPAGHQYKILVLPAGEYIVESLYVSGQKYTMNNKSFFKGWSFEIQPGKLNYMGEVVLDGNNITRWVNTETAGKVLDRLFPGDMDSVEFIYTGEEIQ